MGTATKIEWANHTASPWYGCQHAELPSGGAHPGCLNCYAEAMSKRNPGTLGEWGPAGVRFVSKSFRKNCRRWNEKALKERRRYSVFPSLCDPFEEWSGNLHFTEKNDQGETESTIAWWRHDIGVCRAGEITVDHSRSERLATMEDCRSDLFSLIDKCQQLDFLLLTKRPQNVLTMWPPVDKTEWARRQRTLEWSNIARRSGLHRPNVRLIYSASDQESLGLGVVDLMKCNHLATVIGLSLEPLIGPIDLTKIQMPGAKTGLHFDALKPNDDRYFEAEDHIKWIIVGGESGPGARPCDIQWIRSIIAQCRAAGVACFVKQLGSNAVDSSRRDVWCNGKHHYTRPKTDPDGVLAEAGTRPGYSVTDHQLSRLLTDKKGGDWNEWPEDLRVREFPEVSLA
ncbi:DUF5131 family protein [Anatilimnocola sp. NA78]|uniref:DUF5131 family protein n=1 Tax=Anatilimnocola sp. NA78 TaxID=3415683 RepID=UPI003CE4F5D2